MKIRTFANNQVFSGEHYLERYLHIVNEKLEKIIKGYLYYLSSYKTGNNRHFPPFDETLATVSQ